MHKPFKVMQVSIRSHTNIVNVCETATAHNSSLIIFRDGHINEKSCDLLF